MTSDPLQGLDAGALAQLLDIAGDWVWVQDAELRFIAVSGEHHGVSGVGVDAVLGRRRWELPLIDVDEAAWREHRARLERREPFRNFSYSMRVADGGVRWYAVSGVPVFDASGKFAGYRGIGRDETARRQAELEVRENEERLKAVLELSSDWYWMQDAQHRLTLRRGAVLDRAGVKPEHYLGRTHWELGYFNLDESDWAVHRAQLERREEFRDLLLGRRQPSGEVLWGRLSGRPLYDRDGAFIGYHGVGRGVTAEVAAHEALRHSEAQLRVITENVPAAIAYLDRDLTIRFASQGFRVIFGEDPVRMIGMRIPEQVGADDWPKVRPYFDRMLSGEAASYSRHRVIAGTRRSLQVSLLPDRAPDGAVIGCFTVSLDATEAERMEEVVATNRALESFAYTVSHDLRNPLRRIDTYAALTLESQHERMDAEGASNLGRIRAIAADMGRLVDDLLAFSRANHAPMARSRVDLSAIAAQVAADLAAQVPTRAVDWRIASGVEAAADPQLMRVVLENLLANAWKYSRERTRAEITFDGERFSGFVRFRVRDNGAGFDMAHVGKLFQPFQRLHPAGRFEGSGIGLATVARIVERHGGRVSAEGEEGRGSTFVVSLPAA